MKRARGLARYDVRLTCGRSCVQIAPGPLKYNYKKISMPIRIRWTSKEYFGSGLLLLGMSGMFQLFFIFIGQYFLAMGNHIIVILIPIGIWVALFYATLIIFESYAQIERREKLRSRYLKSKIKGSTLKRFSR